MEKTAYSELAICIPVYNDWESAIILLQRIDKEMKRQGREADILLVDDGSHEPVPYHLEQNFQAIKKLEILHLRRNMGHQRAIAMGLCLIRDQWHCQMVLIMDGDGEDAPEDIKSLLAQFEDNGNEHVVFAKRGKRNEGAVFRFFYILYKILHYLLIGWPVEVGNFSIISANHLNSLVASSGLWNHYAASVFNCRLPYRSVRIDRGTRIAGKSKMNFTSLVIHGLSAISVYADVVGVRLIILSVGLGGLALISAGAIVYLKLFTHVVIPTWATYGIGLMLIFFLQSILMFLLFVFFALHIRRVSDFLPIRDYHYFVKNVSRIGTLTSNS